MEEKYQTALKSLVAAMIGQSYYYDQALRLMDGKKYPLPDSTFRGDWLRAVARLGITHMFENVVEACLNRDQPKSNDTAAAFPELSLILSAMGGHLSLVATILGSRQAAGCDTDNWELCYALRAAILGGYKDIVQLLLEPIYGFTEHPLRLQPIASCISQQARHISTPLRTVQDSAW